MPHTRTAQKTQIEAWKHSNAVLQGEWETYKPPTTRIEMINPRIREEN